MTPSSGSTPTAIATPRPCWTPTAGAGHPGGAKRPGRPCPAAPAGPGPCPGRRVWALEGTGWDGAGLTRFLVDQGEWVVEIDRPTRARGRHGAKSDVLDAVRAGREALARDHRTNPRQRGHRRLNRGGDRQLNRALHHRDAPPGPSGGQPTRASTSRRIAQGKSDREIRRCPRAHGCPPAVPTPGADRHQPSQQSMRTSCTSQPRTRAVPRPEEGC